MLDIQKLKSTLRIEEVAARYRQLHKTGNTYKMLCPFHDDHHPPLMIHAGRQFFKCHACGEGGISFLRYRGTLTGREAVVDLL